MNITEKTIEILQIEPDFVLKEATVYSSTLTVHDTISKIVEAAGLKPARFKGCASPSMFVYGGV